MLFPPDSNGIPRGTAFGVTVAEVSNVDDPENLARVKVKLQLKGAEIETDWLQVMSFFAGKDHGAVFLPSAGNGDEPGDSALVAFADGNPNQPFVLGFLYNGVLKPPIETAEEQQNKRGIKTSSGKTLYIDDSEDGGISIADEKQNSIQINTKDNALALNSEGDMTITAKGNLTIKAAQITLQNTAGSVKIELTEESLTVTGGANLKMSATMIDLN